MRARTFLLALTLGARLWADAGAVSAAPPSQSDSQPEGPPSLELEASWVGLRGYDVTLALSAGRRLRGRFLGMQDGNLVVARAGDGVLMMVPPGEVHGVSLTPDPRRARTSIVPRSNGRGMIAGAAVMLGFALPMIASGGVFMFVFPGFNLIMNVHLLAIGGGLATGGSAMLAVGVERNRYWSLYTEEHSSARRGGFGERAPPVPWSYTLRF